MLLKVVHTSIRGRYKEHTSLWTNESSISLFCKKQRKRTCVLNVAFPGTSRPQSKRFKLVNTLILPVKPAESPRTV